MNKMNWLELTETYLVIKVRGFPEKRIYRRLSNKELGVTVYINDVPMFNNNIISNNTIGIFL